MTLNSRFVTFGMISFIDLLGFSARVLDMENTEQLEAIERDVRRVQEWFEHRPEKGFLRENQALLAKQVLAFSDCLVVKVSSFSKMARSEGDFDVLMNEIANFGMAQARCAMNGIFIRGGSDYGLWYKRKDTLISPAMVQAYDLERRASVPMIAISDDLYRHFADHPHRRFYHPNADPVRRYFRRYEDLPNGEAHWFIDYLPIFLEAADGAMTFDERQTYLSAAPETRDRLANEAFWRDCREMAQAHGSAIREGYSTASSEPVRAKYRWLAAYHNDALQRFFGNPPPALLVEV